MKIKKLTAVFMAGAIMCTTPVPAFAATDYVEEILNDDTIDSLLSDPDATVDIIMYVKDFIDKQEVPVDEINTVVDMAAEHFGISVTEDEKETLISLIERFQDMDLDEEKLRSQINGVYDTLNELGIEKDEVKGFLRKALDFVKGILE